MSATPSECQRFCALSDADALGEALPSSDARFLREHAERCAACAAESRAFVSLSGALHDPSVLSEPFVLAEPGKQPRLVGRRPEFARAPRSRTAWLALGFAAVVALALVPLAKRRLVRADVTPLTIATTPAQPTLVLRAGSVTVNGSAGQVGARLGAGSHLDVQQGRACASFESGVWVCLDELSSARIGALGKRRTLELLAGRLLARLEPQPEGLTFAVESAGLRVLAKGTLFAVELDPRGETSVRLYEGSVRLTARDGRELTLLAPAQAHVGSSIESSVLSLSAPGRDDELIALSRVGGKKNAEAPSVPAAASAEVSAPHASSRRALDSGPSEAANRLRPAELLTQARAARASGHYADAARLYHQLLQTFPRSDEARVSLLSLGELSLSELGDPRAALTSFDAYLKHGGGLRQEASYGRIRALGRLGRSADERAAIQQFLLDYPKSVQATSLAKKLEGH